MAKNKIKRYKQYIEENEDFSRKRRLKKESRHNYKVELEHAIENEEWDDIDYEEKNSVRNR
tara:strand:- start:140 stop:322 length:183 start_codon:yes stop_codon:yes gene_type:complete